MGSKTPSATTASNFSSVSLEVLTTVLVVQREVGRWCHRRFLWYFTNNSLDLFVNYNELTFYGEYIYIYNVYIYIYILSIYIYLYRLQAAYMVIIYTVYIYREREMDGLWLCKAPTSITVGAHWKCSKVWAKDLFERRQLVIVRVCIHRRLKLFRGWTNPQLFGWFTH